MKRELSDAALAAPMKLFEAMNDEQLTAYRRALAMDRSHTPGDTDLFIFATNRIVAIDRVLADRERQSER